MKHILTSVALLAAVALLALVGGCSTTKQTENLLVKAGFKAVTPANPEQQAMLAKLTPGKVSRVSHNGKAYYVMPDKKQQTLYVGGPQQYESYRRLQQQYDQQLAAALKAENTDFELGNFVDPSSFDLDF